jgi:hypothetical protein
MRWLSIRVELVAGATAPAVWPRPGRVIVARSDMTFRMLADTIEASFGRWGPPRPFTFTFAGSTRISHDRSDAEHLVRLDYGERFAYEQDPGDGWVHLCTVGPEAVEPIGLLGRFGSVPTVPTVVDGWGQLPDPHGRDWESDDGVTPIATRPTPPLSDLPDLLPWWGSGAHRFAAHSDTDLDDAAADGASGAFDGAAPSRWDARWEEPWEETSLAQLRAAIEQDDLVHLAGPTLARAAASGDPNAREALRPLLVVLDERDWPGDAELADEFESALALGAPAPAGTHTRAERTRLELTPTPVDLPTLAAVLDGPAEPTIVWRLEIDSGRLLPPSTREPSRPSDPPGPVSAQEPAADPALSSMPVQGLGPQGNRDDLLEFIGLASDPRTAGLIASAPRALWERLEDDLLRDADRYHRWTLFAHERRLGRARRWLTERGLRPLAPWESTGLTEPGAAAPD